MDGTRAPAKKKNILLIITDEERYPPPYETEEIKKFRKEQLLGRGWLKENGVEFHQHYIAATACTPSRTSLFTGHYPSLHGATQTNGVTKTEHDAVWLEPKTVPTMGNYFESAGYETAYKGKWHITHTDLLDERKRLVETLDRKGNPIPERVNKYTQADLLKEFGFHEWIGPEPHGPRFLGTGWVNDPNYAQQTIEWLKRREQRVQERKEKGGEGAGVEEKPFLLVTSLVNPHDIVFFPNAWKLLFRLEANDGTVPDIPPSPTEFEKLLAEGKPPTQQDYIEIYNRFFGQRRSPAEHRKFYYFLHKVVDLQIQLILKTLQSTSFFEDTIIVWTSDHGDQLGSHGGMQQKWHNAYQETLHVPFVIANYKLPGTQQAVTGHVTDILTSHIDLVPTLLGLAGVDSRPIYESFAWKFSEAHQFVGADWSPFWLKHVTKEIGDGVGARQVADNRNGVVYFMTEDEIFHGSNQVVFLGRFLPFLNYFVNMSAPPVKEPCHVESVLSWLTTGKDQSKELWKINRYYTNPKLRPSQQANNKEHWEVYNLTQDPTETINWAHVISSGKEDSERKKVEEVIQQLKEILQCQRLVKRIEGNNSYAKVPNFVETSPKHRHWIGKFIILAVVGWQVYKRFF
eukprot:TRINITY_DN4896_c0_g1_i4.p1 TRINITY_DN4896_c0_g1~~TRINITY_DN4896_c0_g1_i4.p1  ORF type:complete len:647 (-),score=165.12 TRINITY_DN4896_c0_g1_i4:9-1892(-)